VNGIWAGYWVRESSRARVPGQIEQQSLPGTTRATFAPGAHTGYTFSNGGSVTGTRQATLWDWSSANTNARAIINGSPYLAITNGIWAGYWVPESGSAYVAGMREHRDLDSLAVRFSAGTFTGRTFAANGTGLTSRTATLVSASSAPGIAWAVIDGVPRYLIGAGIWSGTWVGESSSVRAP